MSEFKGTGGAWHVARHRMTNQTLPKLGILGYGGRCCGRKPVTYKRPVHRLYCTRCDSEFTPDGVQVANWAWVDNLDGTFTDNRHHRLQGKTE
jgi:hypothetical protein